MIDESKTACQNQEFGAPGLELSPFWALVYNGGPAFYELKF